MATTVYIWTNSPSDVGHAGIQVDQTYMSFWPKTAAFPKKDIKLGQEHDPRFPSEYRVDCRLEDKKADQVIDIPNLNEVKMVEYWEEFKENPDNYNMLKSNCSTVVATVLEVGSNVPPAHSPSIKINEYVNNTYMQLFLKLRFLGNYIHMWTPNDVMKYALQIKAELQHK